MRLRAGAFPLLFAGFEPFALAAVDLGAAGLGAADLATGDFGAADFAAGDLDAADLDAAGAFVTFVAGAFRLAGGAGGVFPFVVDAAFVGAFEATGVAAVFLATERALAGAFGAEAEPVFSVSTALSTVFTGFETAGAAGFEALLTGALARAVPF